MKVHHMRSPFQRARGRVATIAVVTLLACPSSNRACAATPAEGTYPARDSLSPTRDDNPDTQACLDDLVWPPAEFEVICQAAENKSYDMLVSFPSPLPCGDALNDRVTMEWFAAREPSSTNGGDKAPGDGGLKKAPAVVVIHESGSRMEAGRTFARGLHKHGLHTFLIHLPYYGERRSPGVKRPASFDFRETTRQGIADARRARDAVAAIPEVDSRYIALQGTSLGGFVGITTAGLDGRYDGVFIMLAGADLYDIVQSGKKDTAKVREELLKAGYEGERLRELLSIVEPTRIAHRLDPARTWLYNSIQDDVVPIKNARLLAEAVHLDKSHEIELPGDHYSVVIFFPLILEHVGSRIRDAAAMPD
jgi:hypothetical protein